MSIKAIETQYKGYRFRSRLEARWGVFFDALGVEWKYEVEGFTLQNGVRYLPDFWLKKPECWIEIKSGYPTEAEIEKAGYLAAQSRKWVNIVYGDPWPGEHGILSFRHTYPPESMTAHIDMAVKNDARWILNRLLQGFYSRDFLRKGAELHGWKVSEYEEMQLPYSMARRCFSYCEYHKSLSFGHMMHECLERCPVCGSNDGYNPKEAKWETYGRCFTAEETQFFLSCPDEYNMTDNQTLRAAFGAARSARFEHGESGNV